MKKGQVKWVDTEVVEAYEAKRQMFKLLLQEKGELLDKVWNKKHRHAQRDAARKDNSGNEPPKKKRRKEVVKPKMDIDDLFETEIAMFEA